MDAETWRNPAEDGLLSLVIKSEYQWPIWVLTTCYHLTKFFTHTSYLILTTSCAIANVIIPVLQTRKLISEMVYLAQVTQLVKAKSGIWNLNSYLSGFSACTPNHYAMREEPKVITDTAWRQGVMMALGVWVRFMDLKCKQPSYQRSGGSSVQGFRFAWVCLRTESMDMRNQGAFQRGTYCEHRENWGTQPSSKVSDLPLAGQIQRSMHL